MNEVTNVRVFFTNMNPPVSIRYSPAMSAGNETVAGWPQSRRKNSLSFQALPEPGYRNKK